MKIVRLFALTLVSMTTATTVGQGLDSAFAKPGSIRLRLPTSNPDVFFEAEIGGGARFYSRVQPFLGLAITADGRNVYIGR